MNRRSFLRLGLFGSGSLILAAAGLSLRETRIRLPAQELYCFTPEEFSILVAIADCIIPGDEHYPSASTLLVAENIDQFLTTTPDYVQADFKALLLLIENALGNTLLEGHLQTFTQSNLEAQTALLNAWRFSQISLRRTAYKALNGLCQATYFGNPKTHAILGYDGPPSHLVALVKEAGE